MKLPILLLSLLVFVITGFGPINAKIYTWTDEEGNKHYSNTPDHKDAKEVEVSEPNTLTIPKRSPYPPLKQSTNKKKAEKLSVSISSPSDQETIWDPEGRFTLSFSTNIKKKFKATAELDGSKHDYDSGATSLELITTPGEHKVRVTLLDNKGKVIATSDTLTFYMRHPGNSAPKPFF
ncbi:MAG: hypothetical protein CMF25_01560 [Kangiellaceae bacterium]|jgi:hypothetical protein|nr:hypothetical protein [Kangiellaceae bacterium]|tara:strand:+ start:2619 stop:3152 length:534 start_codon:yes stop_codon:yes gene_type:complete